MASLIGRAPKDSYPELLKLNNTGAGVDSSLRAVQDGTGASTPLQLSTTQIALNGVVWPTNAPTSGQVLAASSTGTTAWITPTAYAPLASPAFTGSPTAPTVTSGDSSTRIATTAFVATALAGSTSGVTSFNTRTGVITLSSSDVTTALGFTPAATAQPYDIIISQYGKPSSAQVLLSMVMTRTVNFAGNFVPSRAIVGISPTATVQFTISKNSNQIGTITISGGSTTGTYSGSAVTFNAGDVLTVTAPASVDQTMANTDITISGTR